MNTTRILENVSNDISIEIKKLESELNEYLLPEKQDQLSLPSFHSYAIDLRKSPEDKLYLEYLKELSHLITDKKNNSSAAHVLEKQKMMIMGRKIWSDVVSETDAFDTKYIAQHDIKERTINRIKNLGYSNPDKIYADCLQALQQNTRLIITFSAKRIGLISGIKDFQRLNIFECSTKGEQYLENRNDAEIKFLSFLTPHLKELFVNNIHARPRYGVLQLVDVNTPPNAVRDFGKSFVVLADKAKMNCIFAANDTMKIKNNTPWTMCTISHLAVLLDECDDIKLKAVIKNAESKKMPGVQGYFEAQMPGFNLLNKDLVSHIHVSQSEVILDEKSIEEVRNIGISITNDDGSSYKDIWKKQYKSSNIKDEGTTTNVEKVTLKKN